jgi:hypothetical protein
MRTPGRRAGENHEARPAEPPPRTHRAPGVLPHRACQDNATVAVTAGAGCVVSIECVAALWRGVGAHNRPRGPSGSDGAGAGAGQGGKPGYSGLAGTPASSRSPSDVVAAHFLSGSGAPPNFGRPRGRCLPSMDGQKKIEASQTRRSAESSR